MKAQIIHGDLLDQNVDVIVNAWNRNIIPWWLLLPQGVSGAIKRRGGIGPFKELAKHGSIPLGGAVLTSAGRLPFKAIIHVAGINMLWRASEWSIRQSVRNVMALANEKGFQSIAFPLIGAGSGGFNQERARAIMEDELAKIDSTMKVRVVIYGKLTVVTLLATLLAGCHKPSAEEKESRNMRISTEISSDETIPMSARVTVAKQKLREDIEKAGLARVADDLDRLMVASIRLKATAAGEGELKPGSSKLGGTPDLPEGSVWPQRNGVPMALLAQLQLRDMAPYDIDERLPKSGMLYFFYEAKEQTWGFDPKDRGNWAVIYHDGDIDNPRPAVPPTGLPKECRFRACKLAFHNEITLPSWESKQIERLKLSEKEGDIFVDLLDAIRSEERTTHRMFGHPDQIQGEMKLECQLASHGIYVGDSQGYADPRRAKLENGADDWQLLLQIDSDEDGLGAMWGDCGRVYFWIRQEELKKRDFGNVWLILQCY
jgi:uncharacterized protein YwqG/O-acetyl-ADP-ribose deacetylase (regulator of RNase III)